MRESVITNGTRDKKEEKGDVAKKTNSTVEAIMTANQLDGEPGDDCVLLIPVP